MLKDMKDQLDGLLTEIDIQSDETKNLTIIIKSSGTSETSLTAISDNRIYASTSMRDEDNKPVWISIPTDQIPDSIFNFENNSPKAI